jgi:hypothetical protein
VSEAYDGGQPAHPLSEKRHHCYIDPVLYLTSLSASSRGFVRCGGRQPSPKRERGGGDVSVGWELISFSSPPPCWSVVGWLVGRPSIQRLGNGRQREGRLMEWEAMTHTVHRECSSHGVMSPTVGRRWNAFPLRRFPSSPSY